VTDTDSTDDPTVFTRIIRGELPGRFVWREDDVVAFLTIAPIRPGHTLVVPVAQVDRWTDLDPDTWRRVGDVQHRVGRALQAAFEPTRVGSIIAGMEVPHCHVHLIPIDDERQLDFSLADPSTSADELDDAAGRIRSALRDLGGGASVPAE
jgi:histidine triad (HIT) family protein